MNVINLLPPLPGTYGLLLVVAQRHDLTVGRLGMLAVQPGFYWYVGSAFGPGGLRARVGRHVRRGKSLHWHVDYLREVAELTAVTLTTDPTPREHLWANVAQQSDLFTTPFPRFGASDCRCPAHLFYTPTPPDLDVWQRQINGRCPEHHPIQTIER